MSDTQLKFSRVARS